MMRTALFDRRYVEFLRQLEPDSHVAYYPLCDLGSTMRDFSKQGNNGTHTGVTVGEPGIGDALTSLYYDGALDCSNMYSPGLAADFNGAEGTVAGWAKVSGPGVWTDGNYRTPVWIKVDSQNRLGMMKDNANNNFSCYYAAGGVSQSQTWTVTTTDWFHVAMMWSKIGDAIRYCLNAVPGTPDNTLGTWVGAPIIGNVAIGAQNPVPQFAWCGWLAHFLILNKAVGPEVIQEIYRRGLRGR